MNTGGSYSEADVLRQTAAGDEAAFRCLFDGHRNKLFAYMLRLTASPETAKDIVQDVFLKIWTDRSLLAEIRSFDAYLFTLARNHAFNLAKKSAYRNDILRSLYAGQTGASHETEQMVRYKALQDQLDKAISQLPPQQKAVFTLNRLQGLAVEDIARRLHISEGTVKKHLSLATQALKGIIRQDPAIVLIIAAMGPACLQLA
ncbi:RNA polymerase sigma factor [Chitinophaga sp. GCM10012297]|uniref:RNA polymerase sigma-70 factor n=1 Tax=Chitinophaga chungangae TaxID=2821488 RepID=A0ABS3YI68_9BACT|nr:RNA polymerase sigma-70 factor [Chitinophaga chungangae]MBO9154393.1 RNA polymerase sigma-70 factor [Chitinophaga chungangae]